MKTTYWVVREIKTKKLRGPAGVSKAPHLYRTHGIAMSIVNRKWKPSEFEAVPVELEIPE